MNRGTRVLVSGKQVNKSKKMKETGNKDNFSEHGT